MMQVFKRQRKTAREYFKEDQEDGEEVVEVPTGGAKAAFAEEEAEEETVEESEAPAPAPTPTASLPVVEAPSSSAKKPAVRRKVA
jgi:hypothetical protein